MKKSRAQLDAERLQKLENAQNLVDTGQASMKDVAAIVEGDETEDHDDEVVDDTRNRASSDLTQDAVGRIRRLVEHRVGVLGEGPAQVRHG